MKAALAEMIDKANRKAATSRKQVFARKANDQQHHENLLKHVEVVMDIYRKEPSLQNDKNFKAAMQELGTAMVLSKKRLQL